MTLRAGDRPILAMVESNTTGTGRTFAVAARDRGLRPVLLCTSPERYPWVAGDSVDVVRTDTSDVASVAGAARAAAGELGAPAGIVTSSEYFVEVAAGAAARLGLPGADPDATARCRDKRRQRAALVRSGVAVPAYRPATTAEGAVTAAAALGLPVVVKPVDGTGSRGVRLCSTAGEARQHSAALLAERHDERGRPAIGAVLVEEYVAGPEFSVETFGTEVVGVTAKHLGPAPWFVEYGHDYPADPSPPAAVADLALAAVAALGLDFGPAHTEIRLGPRGPLVIEVNPRLAGGQIPTLVRLATGIDLVGAAVDAAIGASAPLHPQRSGHASIRFLVARHEVEVRRAVGVADAAAVPGVVDVAVTAGPGRSVGGTGSFLDRVGHVIAVASTGPAARAAADAGLSLLELDAEAAVVPEVVG